jgi:hypothetical protein
MNEQVFHIDAYTPAEMAQCVETVGISKGNLNPATMFALAVLAGAFIALGGNFSTIALTDNRLGMACRDCLGAWRSPSGSSWWSSVAPSCLPGTI